MHTRAMSSPYRHDLEIRMRPVAELTPWSRNPRKNDRAAERLAYTIAEHGWTNPILLDRGGQIVAGHTRLKAALRLGLTEVPTITLDAEGPEAAAIAIADNRLAEMAEWDDAGLASLLSELDGEGIDLEGIGYNADELSEALAAIDPPELPKAPEPEEPPEEPNSQLGKCYEMGPHRLICGDSTAASTWQTLMQGESLQSVWTDPPYGIAYKAMRGGREIKNDDSASSAQAVTEMAIAQAVASGPISAMFVCCDWRSMPTLADAMMQAGMPPKACIVWDKMRRVQNLDRFAKQHEMILYSGPYGGQQTVASDVWSFQRDFEPDHPTPKPVELVSKGIVSVSKPGDIIADPFAGSGSTLLACAVTGRIARVIEIDPRYCDVIRRRWTAWADEAGVDAGPGALR